MECQFRPIDQWPGKMTPHAARKRAAFRTPHPRTVRDLEREIEKLGASRYVIQLALADRDIRLDGRPRADARPNHPGVIVAFDSRYGPLKYATDTYDDWQDNMRAIALGLEGGSDVEMVRLNGAKALIEAAR